MEGTKTKGMTEGEKATDESRGRKRPREREKAGLMARKTNGQARGKIRRVAQKRSKGPDERKGTRAQEKTEGENATAGIIGKKRKRILGEKTKTNRQKRHKDKRQDEMEETRTQEMTEGENATVGIKGKKRKRIRGKKQKADRRRRTYEKRQKDNSG
jgi:hypothetical protein